MVGITKILVLHYIAENPLKGTEVAEKVGKFLKKEIGNSTLYKILNELLANKFIKKGGDNDTHFQIREEGLAELPKLVAELGQEIELFEGIFTMVNKIE